jgi:hypothetical protein
LSPTPKPRERHLQNAHRKFLSSRRVDDLSGQLLRKLTQTRSLRAARRPLRREKAPPRRRIEIIFDSRQRLTQPTQSIGGRALGGRKTIFADGSAYGKSGRINLSRTHLIGDAECGRGGEERVEKM